VGYKDKGLDSEDLETVRFLSLDENLKISVGTATSIILTNSILASAAVDASSFLSLRISLTVNLFCQSHSALNN
jgi:hypothetical protein